MVQCFRLRRLANLGVLTRSRRKSEWNRLFVYRDLLIGIETLGRTGRDKFGVLLAGAARLRESACNRLLYSDRISDRWSPDEILSSMPEELVFDSTDRGGQMDDVVHWTRIILVNWIR